MSFNSNLTIVIGKDNKKEILIDHRNDDFLQYAKECGYAKDYGRLKDVTGKPAESQSLVVDDLLLTFKYCNVTYLPTISYDEYKDQSKTSEEYKSISSESQTQLPDDISVHQYNRAVVPPYPFDLSSKEVLEGSASVALREARNSSLLSDEKDQEASRCCSNWSTSNNCSCSISSGTSFVFANVTNDDCTECEKETYPELRTPSIDDDVFFSNPVTPIMNHRNSGEFLRYSNFGEVHRKDSTNSTGKGSYGSSSRMFVSGCESLDLSDEIDSRKIASSPVVMRRPTKNKSDRKKRCASIGAYIESDIEENNARRMRSRVSMYELGDEGWIYDSMVKRERSCEKNRLNLDSDVEDIHKTKKAAVVSLGSIKVIF